MFARSPFDLLFKFIIIGDAAVGKSCLLRRFIDDDFKDTTHTIGVEFGSKILTLVDRTIKLQIWDTAGQERFRSVTRSYYRGAAAAILVFDVKNRDSYNSVGAWLSDTRSLASPNISVVLVGNKTDLADQREVSFMEASRFAQENELVYLETSALTGENVAEMFLKCARTVLSKVEDGTLDPNAMNSGVQLGGGGRGGAGGGRGGDGAFSDGDESKGCPC